MEWRFYVKYESEKRLDEHRRRLDILAPKDRKKIKEALGKSVFK